MNIYYPKIQKEEEEQEEQVPVYFSNMNELSKKRLALLGYFIFQKCSLGQPVSSIELENRMETLKGRYPSLTLSQLIETCELSGSEEKERKTGENYKPYRVLEAGQETLHGIDVLSETTDIPDDVLRNILMDYDSNLHLKEVENTNRFYTEKYSVSKENGKRYGPFKRYYKDSGRKIESNFWNDQLDGEHKEYNKDGQLIFQANYKNGKLDGVTKEFEKGQLITEINYKDGKQDGEYKMFKNGKLFKQMFLKSGLLDGEVKEWFDNGQLRMQEFYKDDKKEGESKIWQINGKLFIHEIYKNGKLVETLKSLFAGR